MATVSAIVTSQLARFGQALSQDEMGVIMAQAGLSPTTEATGTNWQLGLAYGLQFLLPTIPKSVSEGGYSVTWNQEAISAYIQSLFNQAGVTNPFSNAPIVRDASNRW
ncbi:hypothetical protein GCM10027592_29510 [Spirosoma flavus]